MAENSFSQTYSTSPLPEHFAKVCWRFNCRTSSSSGHDWPSDEMILSSAIID